MGNIVYDNHFNANEWFVIIVITIGFAPIWLLPRPFSPIRTTFNILIGIAFGLIFDHTIEVPPFNLYDLGDQSKYELFDMLSYVMYAPFGYWFIYWYERWRLREFMVIVYILAWAVLSVGLEFMGVMAGEFHYKHGYRLAYSYPIYLVVLSTHLMLYRLAFARYRWRRPA